MKTRLCCLAASLVLIIACAATAQPLADRIPQDAVVYIGWSGSESMGPGYANSHLKAVIEASKIPELVKESIPRLLENLGHQDEDAAEMMGLISAIGGPMWRHPSAIYFGGADLTNPNAPMPKLALICQAGAEGKAMVAQIDKVVAAHGQPPVPIQVEEQDGIVVLALGNVEVNAKTKPAAAITGRKEFQTAMAQVGKDPVAAIYVDVEGALEQFNQAVAKFAPAEVKQRWPLIRDASGLPTLKRIAWTGGFDAQEWSSQAFVDAPAPRTGLVKTLLDAKPLSDAALKAIPKTATMAAAGHFDFGGLLGAIRVLVNKVDAEASQEFEQGLDEIKQAIGMDLQSDILETLGDEWVLYSDPNVGGNGMLGITLVNHLKDAAKAERAFTQLEQLANGEMKQGTAGGGITIQFNTAKQGDLTIHYLGIPVIAPSWAIKDGNLYVALYPQVISGAADHVASGGPSILDNPAFAKLRTRLGGGNTQVTAIGFNDLPRTAADGYQEVLMLARVYLGMADLFGAKTPALVLPPLAKLLPHVTPEASVAWSDDAGWHLKTLVPFPGAGVLEVSGMGTILAGEQAMVGAIALPALARARMVSGQVKSASNLRQIGQAMLLYANENKGKYPPKFGDLLLTQDITVDVFVDPQTRNRAPRAKPQKEQADWVNQSSDYEYLGAGKNNTTPANVILAHEKIRPGVPGINMLFGDGHVEWIQVGQAQQMLATQKQNEAAKKGGGQ